MKLSTVRACPACRRPHTSRRRCSREYTRRELRQKKLSSSNSRWVRRTDFSERLTERVSRSTTTSPKRRSVPPPALGFPGYRWSSLRLPRRQAGIRCACGEAPPRSAPTARPAQEHKTFKRHFSFSEWHPHKMSDKPHYVN